MGNANYFNTGLHSDPTVSDLSARAVGLEME